MKPERLKFMPLTLQYDGVERRLMENGKRKSS